MELLIFAGTTEGRELTEEILDKLPVDVTACVATEYGKKMLPSHPRLRVLTGRLSREDMEQLLRLHAFSCVIDATHPYAAQATENIRQACWKTGTEYLRLGRESSGEGGEISVSSAQEAAAFLNTVEGPVLLTTGSKELAAFTQVQGYQERLFVRVLPTAGIVEACEGLGFTGKHLLCMQGPFSEDFNTALLRQIGAQWMVTKDSGAAGGLEEKLRAARLANVKVIMIGRPAEAEGPSYSLEHLLSLLTKRYGEKEPPKNQKWFPLFADLSHKKVVVIGGGAIAARRVAVLLEFGCSVTAISPESSLPCHPSFTWIPRCYLPGDCVGADFALAASNDRLVNHQVVQECRALGIPVNAADRKEECDFFFPAVVTQGPVVVGVTASGQNHTWARETAQRIREEKKRLFPCSTSGKETEKEETACRSPV